MPTFNGHPNWNAWNVSLWINNDEPLYRLACMAVRDQINLDAAAAYIVDCLARRNVTHTPDGAPYTKTSVRLAIRGITP